MPGGDVGDASLVHRLIRRNVFYRVLLPLIRCQSLAEIETELQKRRAIVPSVGLLELAIAVGMGVTFWSFNVVSHREMPFLAFLFLTSNFVFTALLLYRTCSLVWLGHGG
jgi:hypothetical protein